MKKRREKIYTKDVILVMVASFFFMFSVMFINPLINGYAESLGASASFAGLIIGIMSIAAMFLRPIAGNLTDLFSKYQLSFLGGILIFIGIAGCIFTPNANWLLLFRLINGCGYVLCTVCMTTWLALLVPRSHVGEAMGFYGLMNALAMAIAPAVSINLYRILGYRISLGIALTASLLMVVSIQFVKNHALPIKKNKEKKPKFKLIEFRALPVAFLTMLFALPYFTTQADLVIYVLQKGAHVAYSWYFLIYAAILLFIRIALKRYFDTVRFGVWFWLCLIACAFYILMLSDLNNNFELFLAAFGMAIGYGVIYSVLQATALLLAPANEQGLASATFYLGLDFGMAFGPILSGLVDNYLPIKWFYPVELAIIPLALIIYLIYRQRLNHAIEEH